MTDASAAGFFVYGTLKPGELGFGRISEHIERANHAHVDEVGIYLRDGLPALNELPGGRVLGYVLVPKVGHEYALTSALALFEPKHLYTVTRVQATVASGDVLAVTAHFAKSPDAGFIELLEHGWWTATRDPLFRYGLPQTRRLIEELPLRNVKAVDSNMPSFWQAYVPVLGHFLVLCSILERFTTFSYPGKSINERLQGFIESADAKSAARGLRPPPRTTIYSTDKLAEVEWSTTNPWDFWYQVRCNAVHRGKSAQHDLPLVTSCARSMSKALMTVLAGRLPDLAREWRDQEATSS